MQRVNTMIGAILLLPTLCVAAPKILIDPMLTTASDGGLVLTADESKQLVAQVEKSLKLAREILSRPQSQAYFKNRHRLNPIEMMDRDGWSITITAFPDKPNERPGEVECIGMYYGGEGRMAVDVRMVMLGPGFGLTDTGTNEVASILVHEVAHWSDDLDGGPASMNLDRHPDREEGLLAERACGCEQRNALRHHPWREELTAWRREAAKRARAPRALPIEQGRAVDLPSAATPQAGPPDAGDVTLGRAIDRADRAKTVRVIVDPDLARSVDGLRALTRREVREIQALAERSVVQARTWLRQPKFQEYYQRQFGLEPVKLLDETGMTVKVMSLTQAVKEDGRPRSAEYIEATRTIRLHVRDFIVAVRGRVVDQWPNTLGEKIVHELVHAAAIDSGRHRDPAEGQDDEGTVASKALGLYRYTWAPEWMLELPDLLKGFPPLTD